MMPNVQKAGQMTADRLVDVLGAIALCKLRVFQLLYRCESLRANLIRNFQGEIEVLEIKADMWQLMCGAATCPRERLLAPCSWKKCSRERSRYLHGRELLPLVDLLCAADSKWLSLTKRLIIAVCCSLPDVVLRVLRGSGAARHDHLEVSMLANERTAAVGWQSDLQAYPLGQQHKTFPLKRINGDRRRLSFGLAFLA